MDEPSLPRDEHTEALRGLARLNRLAGSTRLIAAPLFAWARAQRRPLRVLDLATGSGDLPVALTHRARKAGLDLTVHGCDISTHALAVARDRADDNVHFFECDVLSDAWPAGYDAYVNSLFLHHLPEDDAVALLARLRDAPFAVVSDLRRCRRGAWLAAAVPRVVTRSAVVHEDAVLSVGNAFTERELRELARRAGLEHAHIKRRWPFRMVLTWERP